MKANFDLASRKCQELNSNARLYEPSYKIQHDLVASMLSQNDQYWMGIQKSGDSWVYLSTNEDVPFTSWGIASPDNWNDNEDCVEMDVDAEWNDANCDIEAWFICETKLIPRS